MAEIRRTTLTEKPISPIYVEEGGHHLTTEEAERLRAEGIKLFRVVPDEEMIERLELNMPMLEREAHRVCTPQYPYEEALADGIYAAWRAALTDKWMPQISLEGYTRKWVRQVGRRESLRKRRVLRYPLKLQWYCTNVICSNHKGMKEVPTPNGEGDAFCSLCGEILQQRQPPRLISIHPSDDEERDRELNVASGEMPEELRATVQRLFEELRRATYSNDQRALVEDVIAGWDPIDVATRWGCTRQLIHMTLDKIKGRALSVLVEEVPTEHLYALLGREIVERIQTNVQKAEVRIKHRKVKKALVKKGLLQEAATLAKVEVEPEPSIAQKLKEQQQVALQEKKEWKKRMRIAKLTAEIKGTDDGQVVRPVEPGSKEVLALLVSRNL